MIEEISFETFVANSQTLYVEYKLIDLAPRDQIIKQCKHFVKRNLYKNAYNLIANNCEHFARGMVNASESQLQDNSFEPYGYSGQVQKTGAALLGISAVVGAAATVLLNGDNDRKQCDSDDDKVM